MSIDNDWIYELVVNGYKDDNEGLSFKEYIKENWISYYPNFLKLEQLSEKEFNEFENKKISEIKNQFPWL